MKSYSGMHGALAALVMMSVLMGGGCPANIGAGNSSGNNQTATSSQRLFVANYTGNGVLSFVNPKSADGNVAPDTNLAGSTTQLNHPADIAVTQTGVLLAANYNATPAITSYAGASTATGDVAPTGNVQGSATGLTSPVSLAIDAANDLLFVANNDASPATIDIYAGASAAAFNGNLAPTRVITSAALDHPVGIHLDSSGDLYVANNGGNNILAFAGAGGLSGTVDPARTLTSPAFSAIINCFVDSGDRLYVVNAAAGGNKVLVIGSASTRNGAVTIDATLTVSGAVNLSGIVVDANQTGYVVDSSAGGKGAIYSFDNISGKNGSFAPNRTISGTTTQLAGPLRVFLVE